MRTNLGKHEAAAHILGFPFLLLFLLPFLLPSQLFSLKRTNLTMKSNVGISPIVKNRTSASILMNTCDVFFQLPCCRQYETYTQGAVIIFNRVNIIKTGMDDG